jgi:hypothetical protein
MLASKAFLMPCSLNSFIFVMVVFVLLIVIVFLV